jgi:23S rRNA (guanosine2251-2'-O)-methyltransferase
MTEDDAHDARPSRHKQGADPDRFGAKAGRKPSRPPVFQKRKGRPGSGAPEGRVFLYGLHTAEEALKNRRRTIHAIYGTRNALQKLTERGIEFAVEPETVEPRWIDARVGEDAVHQGILIESETLTSGHLNDLGKARLVLALDSVTDPHNVGAIMRSAVALGADAILTTTHNSPEETGVLAKSASGALEHLRHIEVVNLGRALKQLADEAFTVVGLDSDGEARFEDLALGDRVVIVLGAEGKGLRPIVREACTALARLDMPGAIRSLNVSNAAAISLYIVRQRLDRV